MNIAIYGGSFNPIHSGHVNLALSLVKQGLVGRVWLLVSPQNPLKANCNDDGVGDEVQPTYSDRLKMAQMACRGIKEVVVSDFERHLPVPSYTINTMTELSKKYPQHQFSLIIGADNWVNFRKWYNYEEILKNYKIFVYKRPGYTISVPQIYADRVIVVDNALYDVSSTEIRNHVKTDMLHEDVLEYIKQKHLYGY